MLKKILICLLIVALLIPMGVAFAEENTYAKVTEIIQHQDDSTETLKQSFNSLSDYLAFKGNKLSSSDKCLSFEVEVFEDNAKVVVVPSKEFTIRANGHSFEFTDDKGNHLTDIKIGNGKVEQLTVIDGKISADYRFEVESLYKMKFVTTIMDGQNKEYSSSIFSLHQGSEFELKISEIKNIKLEGNTDLVKYFGNEGLYCKFTYLTGDKKSTISNITGEGEGIITLTNSCDVIRGMNFKNCSTRSHGGAIVMYDGELRECNISECSSSSGGAIYCTGENNFSTIRDCDLFYNHADQYGGAIYLDTYDKSSIMIVGGEINGNWSGSDGGGIFSNAEGAAFKNAMIGGNLADGDGGGIYINQDFNRISDCVIKNNTANVDGGGVCINGDNTAIDYSDFIGNHALDDGGAAYVTVGTDDASFTHCTFKLNDADDECDDVDGRSDTVITASAVSGGNLTIIVAVAEALIAAVIILFILKRKQKGKKNENA